MGSFASLFNRARPLALLVTRVIVGVVFFWHGLSKFRGGLDGVEGMFTEWGVPIPGLAVLFVALVELVGGIGLILGLGSRIWALVLSIVMIGALFYVKADLGITGGANTDLGLLAALVSIIGSGPGAVSADAAMSLDTEPKASPA